MRFVFFILFLSGYGLGFSQNPDQYINAAEANRIISFLASDSLKGRGNMTREIEQAALYISNEFKKDSLQFFKPYNSYFQPFLYLEKDEPSERVVLNGTELKPSDYIFISPYYFPPTLTLQNFQVKRFSEQVSLQDLSDSLKNWKDVSSPQLIIIPDNKTLLKKLKKQVIFSTDVRLIIPETEIKQLTVEFKSGLRKRMMFNVLGFLPGKSKPGEVVMITAHYDHVGTHANGTGDKIYNGANDNASGTAAMMMLANYFASKKDNQRSILFVAFAGEELGLLGSNYLSINMNTESIVAMINLEMLGKTPAADTLSCIVTGEGTLPRYFRQEAGSINVKQDDNFTANLFKRSDNYPFALQHVPAHTFMIFIPNDPDYHQPSDELQTLDLDNMSAIVKGLLPAIDKLVKGDFTPKRL